MQRTSQKLCLQWSDFHENVRTSFQELRNDKDFTDVTLVCEDGQQVEAHKFVLISSSPFFKNLLKHRKHSHPLVYMRGVKSDIIIGMVDFLYFGEAEVYQENLDSFLALASELQLKGLQEVTKVEMFETGNELTRTTSSECKSEIRGNQNFTVADQKYQRDFSSTNGLTVFNPETINPLNDNSGKVYLEELDQKVKSMMKFGKNSVPGKARGRICNVCGKEGEYTAITNHIEANHLSGLPIPCNMCGTISKTRAALRVHKGTYHKL